MSLCAHMADSVADRFPRVSGDEPVAVDVAASAATFSPRERG